MLVLNLCETAQGGVGIYQNLLASMNGPNVTHHHLVPAEHADFMKGIQNLHVFSRPARGARAVLNMLREFDRLVDELNPDICFFHSTFTLAALARMRLRRDRRPAIYNPHGWAVSGYEDSALKSRVVQNIEGRLCGFADRILCVSHADEQLARKLGYRGHFLTIENAVPDATPNARSDLFTADPEQLNLLFVGRLDRQKGFDILIEAMRRVTRRDIVVHVIGGPVRGDKELPPMPDNMRYVGWVSPEKIDDYYNSADALVVPSRWEGFGLIVPEALRNGTPALVSNRGALPSLIDPGQTGEVFELTPEAISTCLMNLDKRDLNDRSAFCREVFDRRFSLDRWKGEMQMLFEEMCGR